jgi:hypothetical protein
MKVKSAHENGWFSLGRQVSSTNKPDYHDITEILLKVVLNTIKRKRNQPSLIKRYMHMGLYGLILYVCYKMKVKSAHENDITNF